MADAKLIHRRLTIAIAAAKYHHLITTNPDSRRRGCRLRRTHFGHVPLKPQRVYEEMNKAFGRDNCYVSTIGLSQIAAAQFLHVYHPVRQVLSAGPFRQR